MGKVIDMVSHVGDREEAGASRLLTLLVVTTKPAYPTQAHPGRPHPSTARPRPRAALRPPSPTSATPREARQRQLPVTHLRSVSQETRAKERDTAPLNLRDTRHSASGSVAGIYAVA